MYLRYWHICCYDAARPGVVHTGGELAGRHYQRHLEAYLPQIDSESNVGTGAMLVRTTTKRGTQRVENFSDGIFAFAMTLLVLNLFDPTTRGSTLFPGLLYEWPAFLALVTTFVTVLVAWMNHHNMFNYITRISREFMLLNGLLLFFVVLTPFTTLLVSEHLLTADGNIAAAVYAGIILLFGLTWNVLWRNATRHHHLISEDVPESRIRRVTRDYSLGLLFDVLAVLVAFVSAVATLVLIILQAAFYAITATRGE